MVGEQRIRRNPEIAAKPRFYGSVNIADSYYTRSLVSAAMASAEQLPNQARGQDDIEQSSWHGYLDAATRLYHTINNRLLKDHRLSLFDVLLLDALDKSVCGAVRMGDLAATLTLSPSRTSQQVRRLECQGLVRRIASSDDRRVVYAAITRDGRKRVQPALATYAKVVRVHYLDPLSRSQMTAVGDSSRRIRAALQEPGLPAKVNDIESNGDL